MTVLPDDWHKRVLLLSCPEEYSSAIQNAGYLVDTGELFAPMQCQYDEYHITEPCHSHPNLYEYCTVVYCPNLPVAMPSWERGAVLSPYGHRAIHSFPDVSGAVTKAPTIVIVFLNRVQLDSRAELSKRGYVIGDGETVRLADAEGDVDQNLIEEIRLESKWRKIRLPVEICRCFWSPLEVKCEDDRLAAIAENEVARFLHPALNPFLGEISLPLTSFVASKSYARKGDSPEQATPILVNVLGHMHAMWVRKGKGAILFLPEFQDNLAVLRVLLALPVAKLLEYGECSLPIGSEPTDGQSSPSVAKVVPRVATARPPGTNNQPPKDPETAEQWIIWLFQELIKTNEKRKSEGKNPLLFRGSRKIAGFLATKGIEISHTTVIQKIKDLRETGLLEDHWDISDTAANQGSMVLDSTSSNGEVFLNRRSAGQRAKDAPDHED